MLFVISIERLFFLLHLISPFFLIQVDLWLWRSVVEWEELISFILIDEVGFRRLIVTRVFVRIVLVGAIGAVRSKIEALRVILLIVLFVLVFCDKVPLFHFSSRHIWVSIRKWELALNVWDISVRPVISFVLGSDLIDDPLFIERVIIICLPLWSLNVRSNILFNFQSFLTCQNVWDSYQHPIINIAFHHFLLLLPLFDRLNNLIPLWLIHLIKLLPLVISHHLVPFDPPLLLIVLIHLQGILDEFLFISFDPFKVPLDLWVVRDSCLLPELFQQER